MNRSKFALTVAIILLSRPAWGQALQDFPPAGSPAEQHAPGRVLVKLAEDAAEVALQHAPGGRSKAGGMTTGVASLDGILKATGARGWKILFSRPYAKRAFNRSACDRWIVIDVPHGTDIVALAKRLAADPAVEIAHPDGVVQAHAVPDDPLFPSNWGHENTGQLPGPPDFTGPPVGTPGFDAHMVAAWDLPQGYGDPDVIIAIIDSGMDVNHPDLRFVPGYDYGDHDDDVTDEPGLTSHGHGTACSGVAAAIADNGIGTAGSAGGCSIMPLKVRDQSDVWRWSSVAQAIVHAADNGADVISMSFGWLVTTAPIMEDAVNYAFDARVVLLSSAGNGSTEPVWCPANISRVITVGAASPCGDRKRSSSDPALVAPIPGYNPDPLGVTCDGDDLWGSSYGSTIRDTGGAVEILGPTILPYTDILGTNGYQPGDYGERFRGTSCACPYVAGVCALIKSAHPDWGPKTIRAQLLGTATDIVNVESGPGWDRYSGYGMVNAEAALTTVLPLPPEAHFVAEGTQGCAPHSVAFTDLTSGDVSSWSWSFGDGGTSSEPDPVHVYETPGIYDVTLQVTGPHGTDGRTVLSYVEVGTPANARFVSSPAAGPSPLTVTFYDLSTDASGRVWDFGDGTTDTVAYPTHVYAEPDRYTPMTYTVRLIATGGCRADTLIEHDYVTITYASDTGTDAPTLFSLEQNAPNPFNASTFIRYTIAEPGAVTLKIYDVSGNAVRTLVREVNKGPGVYEIDWDGRDDTGRPLASGTFFYRLESAGYSETKRMVLVK